MSTVTLWPRALIVSSLAAAPGGAASAQTASPQAVATPISTPTLATPSPKPTESQATVRADLGKLDALAQRLIVGQGANRNDLIASDSAIRSLRSTSGGTGVARAANALTAALAPVYPAVGDRVPARVHQLDYLHRSMRLDVAAGDWVRANADSISARSTWRAARAIVTKAGAGRQGAAYTGALNAVQDAITARGEPLFSRAIARADRSLGSVEKVIDTEEPPWRRFLHSVGF